MKDIQTKLRQAMNGVASAGMQACGMDYKLNFGVSLPEIKKIASLYAQDSALAQRLWEEDVRELKIMATLLQPSQAFAREQAERWLAGVRHMEIAGQYCINLLQYLSFADTLAADWILREEGFAQVTGFLLYARLFAGACRLSSRQSRVFLNAARQAMDKGISCSQRSAVSALKRYGRQSRRQANRVLHCIAGYAACPSPEKQEFYNDIKWEFDYYFGHE
ncbi:MAG: DNA alkylation repair protein [Tannerellaceae bacterium]|nr:DNA alkylation repair protein [Tannerellaceae bacterium]